MWQILWDWPHGGGDGNELNPAAGILSAIQELLPNWRVTSHKVPQPSINKAVSWAYACEPMDQRV